MTLPGRLVRDPAAQLNFDALEKQLAALRAESTVLAALPTTGLLDGRVITYQTAAMASAGVAWRLRYNAASASAYKWEFLGGASLTSQVLTTESTTSTVYVDLATVGPSVTAPLAGAYQIGLYVSAYNNTAGGRSLASVKLGGAVALDTDTVVVVSSTVNAAVSLGRSYVRTLAAGDVVKVQYRVVSNTGTWEHRSLEMCPVRVG